MQRRQIFSRLITVLVILAQVLAGVSGALPAQVALAATPSRPLAQAAGAPALAAQAAPRPLEHQAAGVASPELARPVAPAVVAAAPVANPLAQATLGIGNTVWKDLNGNGLRESGEPGIPGVTVGLYDAGGNLMQCTQPGRYDTYRDEFSTISNRNSNGTLDWSNLDWVQTGTSINLSNGNPGGALQVYGGNIGYYATRPVDLAVFASNPTLRFDYNMAGAAAKFNIQYSSNGGTSFTTLAVLSDNNNGYKTISYTLPITVANAQIRIAGFGIGGGAWAYFDNVTVLGQMRYPATVVTDANGLYTLTSTNCVQPNTAYQIRIDTTQLATNPLFGLFLTTPNAGGVTSNDPTADGNDSDASTVMANGQSTAQIPVTSPASGVNNSYAFGFVSVSIGNSVWKDANGNGLQDPGEPPLAGATVGLYDSRGNPVMCMQAGRYETYQYSFNVSGVYNGSNGTLPWSPRWHVVGGSLSNDGGNPGGSLLLYPAAGDYAVSAVDLSVFAIPPTLSIDYNFGGLMASFAIQYSTDNGITFQTLATFRDNNSTYKTVTYTLPTTLDTAQIRLQGISGSGLYVNFDNVTIRGQMRYPVTAVTDANGRYTFSGAECVQPNTPYQVRIATTQSALLGLALTTPNAGGVTSNSPTGDVSDSDATAATINTTPYAVIDLTAPAANANNSYAFGFVPSPVGALQVNKTVNGAPAPAGWGFTLSSVNCPLPPSLTNPITTTTGAGGSVTFANLLVQDGLSAACQYQVSEKSQTGWFLNYLASDPVNGVKVTANSTTATAVVNSQPQTCNAGSGNVGGLVFLDFNMDGQQNNTTNEVGFTGGGIIVRAYGKNNQLLASVPLQPDGSYVLPKLPNLTTDGVRIEFQNLAAAGVEPTSYGAAASTANRLSKGPVRFVNVPTCNVDLGVNQPVNYCQANPTVAVPTQWADSSIYAAPSSTLRVFSYENPTSSTVAATTTQIGATWGEAYQASTKTLFLSAFTRQNINYGPLGRGGIYAVNMSNPAARQVTPFVDLQTLGVNAGGNGPRLASDEADVAKSSLGGIDISEDGKTLYVMNLYKRELVALDIAAKTVTAKIPVPTSFCTDSWTGVPVSAPQDGRPWAVKVHNGEVYIGVACTAETSQLAKDLHGYILRLSGDHFVPFYDFIIGPSTGSSNFAINPQPWPNYNLEALVADIDFRLDGSLFIGLVNRASFRAYYYHQHRGAVFIVRKVNGVFDKQPSLYYQYSDTVGVAFLSAGIAYKPDTDILLTTGWDAGTNVVDWFNPDMPGKLKALAIPLGEIPLSHKSLGLGDLEILCDPAPLEIGNRVWNDSAQPNGVQDPNEPGIPNVIVGLYNITGTLVATTTTSALGEYYFNNANVPGGLKPNTDYTIRINRTQTALVSFIPTLLDQVVNNPIDPDEHDSDGNPAPNPGYVTTGVRTGSAGQNDYSFDFGFTRVEIGNYVWKDDNVNGKQDSDEPGIPGVTVGLYDGSGNAVLCSSTNLPVTTLTDATGHYTFTSTSCVLPSTAYQVGIDLAQPALRGFQLTASNAGGVTSNDPAGDDNDSDASVQTLNGKATALIKLTSPAVGANYSYDFGFIPLAIGNYVWKDNNADGLQDNGEPGIPGVTVGLYDTSGNAVMCPQVGRYETYADGFNLGTTNGSTGSLTWGTTWSFAGSALTYNMQGNPGGSISVYGATTSTAARTVDLSVFAGPSTLSFDYRQGNGPASFNVQYSTNGGTSFTTLATLNVNTASYQTINYTLPITAANAQIRIQGATGGGSIYASFDNVTIQGQARYPVTTVTDANGFYYFTNLNCVQPNTTYQVRIDTTQTPDNPLYGLFLTKQNAGGVTSNDATADDSDSDASMVTSGGKPNAVINATSPAFGVNYSYDFGFIPVEIGNYVWLDTNANGLQDNGEPPIPGATAGLYDASGNVVMCTQTGRYDSYRDEFSTTGLTNSNGTLDWSSKPWAQSLTVINASNGNPGGALQIYGGSTSYNATRAVDLSAFVGSPLLRFDYNMAGNVSKFNIQYSSNGGTSFTTLAVLSDNNSTYKTITYTLPITAANAQIRIAGFGTGGGTTAYFDNVTVLGQMRYPVTTVTDANGFYYFTGANCLQPSTNYQVRLDMTQAPPNPLFGLALTKQNAGGVTSNDPTADDSDSDASGVTLNNVPNAVINLTSPAAGVNYSYDFGFVAVGIGNYVWKDTNLNGLQDNGEPPIAGVTVGLYDNSGNAVLCPQISPINLGLNKSATQVSDYTTGNLASNAVDGNTTSGGSMTGNSANSWWQVDLGQATVLQQVVLYAYPGGTHTQSEQVYVLISNQPFASTNLATTLADPNVWHSPLQAAWTGASLTVAVPSYLGRYVRIQHKNTDILALGEVQVLGTPSLPVTTITDSTGHYTFTGASCVQPSTTYQVRLDLTQDPLFGLFPTTQNAGGVTSNDPTGDDSDSDASRVTINSKPTAVINATSPATGMNYSYDFGFVPVEIGNYVWKDTDGNGKQDAGEPAIPGVTVGLYDAGGNAVMCPQVGRYDSYRDEFSTTGLTNSNGTLDWGSKAWVLSNTGILNTNGNPGGALQLYGGSNLYYATRAVDLSVFMAPPTLSFDYNMAGTAAKFNIQYSSNGGTSFTTLAVLSDNNNSYKTITYTLPITVANAQIRLQGANTGSYAYFDNLTIRGQVRYPVTTVTDADGIYTFTGQDCVQPSTTYQVRLDLTQAPLVGLFPTTQNAGGVTSNDPTGDDSDSDASRVTINGKPTAVINATSPAVGANYSYDFGFISVAIGNYVWKDTNTNGLQDAGEPPIPGVTVGLYDAGGNPVMCPQTGRYDTYADAFNSGVANGSTGSLTWGTTWSFAGSAAAYSVQGNPGGSMYVYGATTSTAARTVDLSVFAGSPTLSFDYIQGNAPASFNVQYSSNGGTSFTTLATLSVNNTSYKTITYTLPITAANAQIRLQGVTGGASVSAYFDNVTVQGQLRYPVTDVTDSNGYYTFTSENCVQPSTPYQVRIDTTQTPANPLFGLFLTTPNVVGVTSNDPTADDTDSDASSVTANGKTNAVINLTSPAAGVNNSYDFGFVPVEIGNYVWKDFNANGLQESDEPPIPGVTVGLYDNSGNAVLCPQVGRYDIYRDEFTTTGLTNSNGTLNWSSKPWVLTGTSILSTSGNPGGALQVNGASATAYATRAVDLSGFAGNPTLSFDYNMAGTAAKFNIQYSSNGGTSFTTLAVLSDNNNGYKTITYTLPITVANAQIRIAGFGTGGGTTAYFDNLTLQGQVGYPVTDVTDANGLYTFIGANCLQPSTNYQVRIDTTQTPDNPLFGLFLTKQDAGGVTSNDPTGDDSDSDASSVTVSGKASAVINLTSPVMGANYSYDFGFISVEIGNYVWKDTNANGLQESGEPPIPGLTVSLYDATGKAVLCPQVGRYDSYRDEFTTPGNANSNGMLDWSSKSWVQTGTSILSTSGNPGGALSVSGASTTYYATRAVDLSVFVTPPTLSFDYNMAGSASQFIIRYSANGGTSFTTLAVLSDNNSTYKTITYTLPITAANAQIRIQGSNTGTSAYFDNLTIQGQARTPVTSVTDSNGFYRFAGSDCLQPSTPYQVRIANDQYPLNNLHLTTQDAGGVTSNDPTGDDSDSDAASVTISNTLYARINALSPAAGTNYSYDFGFTGDTGAIVLRKATTSAGSSQVFNFTSNVPGHPSFTLRAGESYTMTQVPIGVYAVTETLTAGWTQIASSCTNVSTLGAVLVSKNNTTTCTITNALQPTTSNVLTVTKTVNWNSNPPNAAQQFNITLSGPSFPGGKADTISAGQTKVYTNVVAGVYTVTEISPGAGWVTTYSVPSGVVTLNSTTVAPITAGPISGNLFRDYNADGVDAGAGEPGVGGVTVTAYDPNGVVRGTATTDASGNYNFTPTGSGPYRVEVSNLPAGFYPTRHNGSNRVLTQFVTTNGGASNINFGVNDPADYSQANPNIVANVYINGDASGSSGTLVKFPYNVSGTSPAPTTLATKTQIGSTWGLAYARTTKTLYAAAFLKRQVGLGPNGLGAIYAINTTTGAPTLFANLATLGASIGTVLSNSARGLGTSGTASNDAPTYAQIGKVGLGDMDIADDEKTLYVVSLNDKTLYALNVPAGTLAGSYIIPDPGCTGGAWRPFATKYKGDAVYVGGVCDAQASQKKADLKAYVYRFTPGVNSFTQVFTFPLNYPKGEVGKGKCPTQTGWFPWVDTFPGACLANIVIYPQPMLSDIEFDVDGSLILAFVDRLGHQMGYNNYAPTSTTLYEAWIGGDLLRAYNNNGVYVLENNGVAGPNTSGGVGNNQGPGGGEFYYGDASTAAAHYETAMGGLAFKPGSGEVVSTVMDPVVIYSGGLSWLSNTLGNATRTYQIYDNLTGYFGKANGLGDLELLLDPAPLEIGSRVWKDLNGNGVQDPGEPGLANVTVALQSANGMVTLNTDANGLYFFTVNPSTAYTLTINPSQAALSGLTLTQANMQAISGSPYSNDARLDTRDSDAVTIGGKATIFYTTGSAGQNNHGLDFGWAPAVNGKVTINNKAPRMDWGDDPDQYGTTITKTGAAHIIVPGLRLGATEDSEIDGQPSVAADGDGADEDGVRFPTLKAGSTAVLTVTATNTGTTAAMLYGWIDFNGDGQFTASERVTTTVPAGTNNGVFYLTYNVPVDAVSATYARFRLSTDPAAAVPTGVALDGEVEDYPVTLQTVPLVRFGDRVWLEADADGLANTGVITPIVGVVITATTGTNSYTTTTDSQGYYSFTVTPGTYTVRYGSVPAPYGATVPSATPGGNAVQGNAGSYREVGNPDQSHANGTTVTLSNGEANWQVDFAFHAPHADLHLVKLVDKSVAKNGDTVVYTLVLTNDGPDTATNVIVKDLLPATVLYQSATAQQGAYDVNTGLWTVGTVAVNSSVTLTITVKIR